MLPIPGAFRSELRPSSPYGAKASVVCPYTLNRNSDLSESRYTLQFFSRVPREGRATQNYAVVKELPRPRAGAVSAGLAGEIVWTCEEVSLRGAGPGNGGRDWNRTSDLVLIRDAL